MTSAFVDKTLKDLDDVFSPIVVRGYKVTQAADDTEFTIDGVDLSKRYAGIEDGERVSYDTEFFTGKAIYGCDLREIFAAKGTVRKFLHLDINNLANNNNSIKTPSKIEVTPTWKDHNNEVKTGSMFTMNNTNPSISVDLNDVPESEKPPGFVLKVSLSIKIFDSIGNNTTKTFTNITL